MTGWQSKVVRRKPTKRATTKAVGVSAGSVLEQTLYMQLRAVLGPLNVPVSEYRFDPARRWRFDFAWPARKLAVEVEGGIWVDGRHGRGAGMEKDMEKYNRATVLGWAVLRFSPGGVKNGNACREIEAWLAHDRAGGA